MGSSAFGAQPDLSGDGENERIAPAWVRPSYLSTLLVPPLMLLGLMAGCGDTPTHATKAPVPTHTLAAYAKPGPFAVSTASATDGNGQDYILFHPADYRALGFASPIVTWGNGTYANPNDYTVLLGHLASWGFTVVASTLPNTGSGKEIADGARYLVAEDSRPGSRFFHRLDAGEVAALGHSQGAGGAARAAIEDRTLIKTVVTFSLPWNGQGPAGSIWDRPAGTGWSVANPDCPTARACWSNPADITRPTFFISTRGPYDSYIAAPEVEACYFHEVRAPAALGILTTSEGSPADHISIEDNADGGHPTAFLGPATAWLLYHLRHDQVAARVFTGRHPALLTDPDWAGSMVKAAAHHEHGCK